MRLCHLLSILLMGCAPELPESYVPAPTPMPGAPVMGADGGTIAPPTPPTTEPVPNPTTEPPGPAPAMIELGPVMQGSFEVPAGTIGVALGSADPTFQTELTRTVIDPLGRTIFEWDTPIGITDEESLYNALHPRTSAAIEVGIAPGTWQLDAFADTPIRVYLQHAPPTGYAGGTLDLQVHIAAGVTLDGALVNAANAAAHAGLQSRLDAFYAMAGGLLQWTRGTVAYHDAPAELTVIHFDTDDAQVTRANDVGKLVLDQPGVHVLVVNEIVGPTAGFAPLGGSPVPGFDTVVVESQGPEEFAGTLMHEIGHFMGLGHTTDALLDWQPDLFTDTPTCPQGSALESCPDRSNLMFPMGGYEVSPMQAQVLQASPFYRPATIATASLPVVQPRADAPQGPRGRGLCGITMARLARAALDGRVDIQSHPILSRMQPDELRSWRRWGHLNGALSRR